MPTTTPRSISLTFDTRYVFFALDVWRRHRFTSVRRDELEALIGDYARDFFVTRTSVGCHEETVAAKKIAQALNLLRTLQSLKQTTSGPKGARAVWLTATPTGDAVLNEQPVAGGLRPHLAQVIVASSPGLQSFLHLLQVHGPFTQPVLHLEPGAPRRGAAYVQAVADGIAAYQAQAQDMDAEHAPTPQRGSAAKKPTAAQLIKSAQLRARQQHLAGGLQSLDTVVSTCLGLGLMWTDLGQINEVLAARQMGSASIAHRDSYAPHVPSWDSSRVRYIDALRTAHAARADATGYTPIGALRGALGRTLALSPAAVDYVLVSARDAGDRGEIPISLHFEPNEDLLYSLERDPLIWRDHAYDFVEVRTVLDRGQVLRPKVVTVP
jgi:hypothetical protein